MPEMTPEQETHLRERNWISKVRVYREQGVLDERKLLLANRAHFAMLRQERGNRLPSWGWPHERRPWTKWPAE